MKVQLRAVAEWTVIGVFALLVVSAARAVMVDKLAARRATAATTPRVIPNSDEYARRGFVSGSNTAEHTLVVFSDFECAYCRGYASVIDSLLTMYPTLRVVERHYPIAQLHPFAVKAANAAECAGDWDRYESVRDVLYTRPAILEAEEWGLIARVAGIADTASFAACVRLEKHAQAVAEDLDAAGRLGCSRYASGAA